MCCFPGLHKQIIWLMVHVYMACNSWATYNIHVQQDRVQVLQLSLKQTVVCSDDLKQRGGLNCCKCSQTLGHSEDP